MRRAGLPGAGPLPIMSGSQIIEVAMASLQDQLLKAGVVDKKKAKQVKHEKHKAIKQGKGTAASADDVKERARLALAEKAARDREINLQRQREAEVRAIAAQVRQLIEMNRVPRERGDVPYQFTDGKKIKKLHVSDKHHRQLTVGTLAIARLDDDFVLIPAVVAEKILLRDEAAIAVLNKRSAQAVEEDEEDPYAAYQIPDDLMW